MRGNRSGQESGRWNLKVGLATAAVIPAAPLLVAIFLLGMGWAGAAHAQGAPGGEVELRFRTLCAPCHGIRRYGGYAPPLIPSTLTRKKDADLERIILEGLPQTQMPPHREVLRPGEAKALVAYLRTPVKAVSWNLADISASRLVPPPPEGEQPPAPPLDRPETMLVVERGTGEVVVLDGNTLTEAARFHVGRIHGGPKFTEDYSAVFASTRDGTLVRYDLVRRRVTAKIKVAVNTRNIAVSPDGNWVVAANQLPPNLVVLDGALNPLRVIPLPGKPSGVYHLPGEATFVLTLREHPLLYRLGIPSLGMEPTTLPQPFEDFTFIPGRKHLLASARGGKQILLYDLERNKVLNTLDTSGLPHLFSATYFMRGGTLFGALNHIGEPTLSILDLDRFTLVKQFTLAGAGYFVRTHPGTPYLWADTNTDRVQLVDKATLTLQQRTLHPQPGRKAMHVEFTADGSRALLSVWHPQGAVVIYDAKDLKELGRMPFNMPIGKYNARNKTRFPLQ